MVGQVGKLVWEADVSPALVGLRVPSLTSPLSSKTASQTYKTPGPVLVHSGDRKQNMVPALGTYFLIGRQLSHVEVSQANSLAEDLMKVLDI